MRRQIFCQIVKKLAGILPYVKSFFVRDDGKYLSRFCTKPQGVLYEVLPEVKYRK